MCRLPTVDSRPSTCERQSQLCAHLELIWSDTAPRPRARVRVPHPCVFSPRHTSVAHPTPFTVYSRCYLPEDQQRLQEAITTGFGEATAFNACVRNLLRSSLEAPVINISPKRGSSRRLRNHVSRLGSRGSRGKFGSNHGLSSNSSRRSMGSSPAASPPPVPASC